MSKICQGATRLRPKEKRPQNKKASKTKTITTSTKTLLERNHITRTQHQGTPNKSKSLHKNKNNTPPQNRRSSTLQLIMTHNEGRVLQPSSESESIL